jgi:hypothetical protein
MAPSLILGKYHALERLGGGAYGNIPLLTLTGLLTV